MQSMLPRIKIFILLFVLIHLFDSRPSCAASSGSIVINSAHTSVFNATGSSLHVRTAHFPITDSNLQLLEALPSPDVTSAGLNTNNPDFFSGPTYFSFNVGEWSFNPQPMVVGCAGGGTAVGSGGSSLEAYAWMFVMDTTNVENFMADHVVKLGADTHISYLFKDTAIKFNILTGSLNGKTVTLNATMAYGSAPDPNNDDTGQSFTGDMFIGIDWGTDPLGNHECIVLRLTYLAGDSTSDSTCLPLQQVSQGLFGTDSAGLYFYPRWDSLAAEVGTDTFYMDGPAPDLLFLYNFSGANSVAPSLTVPPGQLDPDTVIPLEAVYTPDTNILRYFNQYDAGVAFNLPKRFNPPNPVPPPSGFTPGGNACGPTSTRILLSAIGLPLVDPRQIFDNTTTHGLAVADNASDEFLFPRAQDWLRGAHHYTFSAPSPLPSNVNVSYLYAQDTNRTGASIVKAWDNIDEVLKIQQPIAIRTDLGFGTSPGGGHIILLLGVGHNDALGALYGTSGDYYLVADPAGHWFASSNSTHYATVQQLDDLGTGITYGGWFAMYPKELLQVHIYDKNNHIYRVTALTVGLPFHKPGYTVTVHSPLTMIITDPSNQQTGVTSTGTVLSGIPSANYQQPSADEEELGDSFFDPDGPKGVAGDDPIPGTYQIDLTATNSGPYSLDWIIYNADGSIADQQTFSGTVSLGDHLTYSFKIGNAGPAVSCSLQGNSLALSWPTNATGFTLQTTTNIADTNSWVTAAGSVATTNGQFLLSIPISDARRFYRLKQ